MPSASSGNSYSPGLAAPPTLPPRQEPLHAEMPGAWQSMSSQSIAPSASLSTKSVQRLFVFSGVPAGLQAGSP